MKKFDLEEYLKNPNKPIITRCGCQARIVCTNKLGKYPIVALIKGGSIETMVDFESDGKYRHDFGDNDSDLFFAPEKKEGWINVYRGNGGYNTFVCNSIFATKEEAQRKKRDIIATIKIEWEE